MKNTTIILQQLRLLMLNASIVGQSGNLSAYIVPSSDAHHNIRRADCDQRLGFISGFDGSSGTAIITQNGALLWTDARYFLQAEQQMDDNWTLMKEGVEGTLSQSEWLTQNLPLGSKVAVDSSLYSISEWKEMETALLTHLELTFLTTNLVDIVWGQDRPPRPVNPVTSLDIQFSGKTVQEKLLEISQDILAKDADTLVITELDEIAWLLNLRGTDLPQAPTFFAFALLTKDRELKLCLDDSKLSESIKSNLVDVTNGRISFHSYNDITSVLDAHVQETIGKIWLTKNCNYALSNTVSESRKFVSQSPIALRKTIKNFAEINGMQNALITESAVLCKFYSWLEKSMTNGELITEVSAADKLSDFKKEMENFVSLSFKTISASGPNGAIIHYFPTNETDQPLSNEEMYLIDAGSHYLDGTTDTTRTFFFGTSPTDHQKDCYTRVLKGQIAIATSKFPKGSKGSEIDSFARRFLWAVGLDYGHVTGHGVGAYLNVGEGPQSIDAKYNVEDPGLQENMVTSNEPGYYEDNYFGIRLENMVRVVNASEQGFLKMEDMTFVPYSHKLIKIELLTSTEINYLNEYQEKCRQITGRYILEHSLGQDVYQWLLQNTQTLN